MAHNVGSAKRADDEGEHVIIIDRGEPSLVLLPIADCRRMMMGRGLTDFLRMPGVNTTDIGFDPVRISAKEIDA